MRIQNNITESSLTKSVTLSTPFSSDPFASLGSPAQFANRTTAQSGAVHTQTMTTNQHQNTSNRQQTLFCGNKVTVRLNYN